MAYWPGRFEEDFCVHGHSARDVAAVVTTWTWCHFKLKRHNALRILWVLREEEPSPLTRHMQGLALVLLLICLRKLKWGGRAKTLHGIADFLVFPVWRSDKKRLRIHAFQPASAQAGSGARVTVGLEGDPHRESWSVQEFVHVLYRAERHSLLIQGSRRGRSGLVGRPEPRLWSHADAS
jgi:hypothetical protein